MSSAVGVRWRRLGTHLREPREFLRLARAKASRLHAKAPWVPWLVLPLAALAAVFLLRSTFDEPLAATVARGRLTVRLTAQGTLKPVDSITYRSPLSGREAEIVFLAPEGALVAEGDLVARIDTTEVLRERDRAVQEHRQAEVDLKVAEGEQQESVSRVESLTEGQGALALEEARARVRLAERKAERTKRDYEGLKPLLERGFITRDELDKAASEFEQAESELTLARRKAQIDIERDHPREGQRARLLVAQKTAQVQNAQARVLEAEGRVKALRKAIDDSSLYARAPGLVVYEDFMGAGLRRKIRVGDRVTGTQGLVTIPQVNRMLVETSVAETDVHRLQIGQAASIRLDAFPDLVLTGKVARVGTLARTPPDRPESKRFDLTVEIDPTAADLRPEMTARVDVQVADRADALLVPVNAVFPGPEGLVCRVVRRFGIETRRVELGASDDVMVEVLAGLTVGERVALTDSGARNGPAAPAASPAGDSMRSRLGAPATNPLAPQ